MSRTFHIHESNFKTTQEEDLPCQWGAYRPLVDLIFGGGGEVLPSPCRMQTPPPPMLSLRCSPPCLARQIPPVRQHACENITFAHTVRYAGR